MTVRKVAAIIGVLLAMGVTTAEAAETGGLSATAIDQHMRDYIERTRLPGALVAVTKGDQVVYAAGYGRTAGRGSTGSKRRPSRAGSSPRSPRLRARRTTVDRRRPVRAAPRSGSRGVLPYSYGAGSYRWSRRRARSRLGSVVVV
ncbi:hypothetical protein ABZ260_04215 [Streptosporangium sp. NPDC006013]|uniref:hypothetical protein n=1 Tax=Streptosporangium sp. NPDC006013 TaxID=3155596 RepID=UPI0033A508F2